MAAFTKEDLKRFQAESLPDKEQRSLAKISEWFVYWNNEVYVAFSGGKDSSVLADLCAFWCRATGATLYLVFVNTGLEYPEIQKHVKNFAEYLRKKYNIEVVLDILRPQMRFDEVIKKYGYPVVSKEVAECVAQGRKAIESGNKKHPYRLEKLLGTAKDKDGNLSLYNIAKYKPLLETDFLCSHMCCNVMKKKPVKDYIKRTGRKPITAQMASESRLREQQWLRNGCNGFNMSSPISNPMSFWTEQDVLQYIKQHEIPIASVYGEIEYANNPEQIRIEDLGIECDCCEELCTTGCQRTGCIFCGFGCHLETSPNRFERLKVTHPRQYEYCIGGGEYDENGIWRPNAKGLGMGHVFDELNKIYGKDFIKY
jgi:3'-phosphoadenosine 5'-phosphosulfate sulfotransferase (PAPS reductase)/FAD synthetase